MIDYSLRLSKDIVRKLIANRIRSLDSVGYSFKDYQYIGFGSVYFIDFILFHKTLGINNMISFEKDNIDRPSFNRPYDFINVVQGLFSEKYETDVDFSKKSILWLDYEDSLKNDIIQDIDNIVRYKITAGSILIFTFNCKIPGNELEKKLEYINKFRDEGHIYLKKNKINGGNEIIYIEPKKEDIIRENKLELRYLEILQGKIEECIKDKELNYQLLFKYSYKDGARMVSIGFVFDKKENIEGIRGAFTLEEGFINIEVPILTLKEKKQIDQNIETLKNIIGSDKLDREKRNEIKKILKFQLEIEQLNSYINFHSEYPHFAEIIV